MSGYLEAYGSSEEHKAKRARTVKLTMVSVLVLLLLGALGYALLHNSSEEKQVKSFLAKLHSQDYSSAYAEWGCTAATPCRDYSMQKFMDDWGPKSSHADVSAARIGLSQSCGTGVLLRLDYKAGDPVPLWVERGSHVLSFAPWPECPGRHLHLGAFIRSLFSR